MQINVYEMIEADNQMQLNDYLSGKITQKQRGELYKDINGGIKKVTGVGSRTQLRDKHYQTVVDFINDWEPSTATKTIVRQINFLEE